jgi:hypothetical protein
VNVQTENAVWTWPLVVIGLVALGTGIRIVVDGGQFIAIGVGVILLGVAIGVMAFAGRRTEEGKRD